VVTLYSMLPNPIGLAILKVISMSTISIDYYLDIIYSINLEVYSYLLYYIMANRTDRGPGGPLGAGFTRRKHCGFWDVSIYTIV
jgi:hypothetical protein